MINDPWPTIPVMQPIEAECRAMPHLPTWEDLEAYNAEKELADAFITCDECGEKLPADELRGSRRDGWYCSDCYKPDAFDNAEHRYRQQVEG